MAAAIAGLALLVSLGSAVVFAPADWVSTPAAAGPADRGADGALPIAGSAPTLLGRISGAAPEESAP